MFAVSIAPAQALFDAPRDKRTYFREINYIAAAFQYQKKNYNSA
ncbi:glucosamine-6-phosphate deaminase [Salmonella enterica subsp. enterica serovar Montevideo]|nr:glucosamine-6-phosphate deaminase [Salmonella enterica]EDO6165796.1 glucosamine-6-phosphate deaminase [Salmonella enterica subsp. enterica serovar Montevideo]